MQVILLSWGHCGWHCNIVMEAFCLVLAGIIHGGTVTDTGIA